MFRKSWKLPPKIKIYEALGALADKRVEVKEDKVTVISSDGSKKYTVLYEPTPNAITANDNGSYWQGYVGYPAIALLMHLGKLPYDIRLSKTLSGIPWKEINTKYKNDFSRTQEDVDNMLIKKGFTKEEIEKIINGVYVRLEGLDLKILKRLPPPRESKL